ncbi:Mu transposase C-terminal domain-containing protein [Listeria booriae]|uniref:Mu transposase C-terminal domain-containing protein n=1 Tax=Listeria booriae TaxID=1552123 RepID=UPI00162A3177|nr:Mu transposase C-terminal domain-containing protein [Listeria booriae]MBC1211098.1 DDE-type integrase/transposase/recombinase [Listeria booriae]MBC1228764.1 DDE-type integrase/transposase/recombinase [Listeria booriae]MBC2387778.1 DDE-type integrase/transposase/recombinase [Listeria booriae]
MNKYKIPLTAYPEQVRELAVHRYKVIEPYLLHEKTCKHIIEETGLSERTIWYWISQYRMDGLKGLLREPRKDKGSIRVAREVKEQTTKLLLQHKKRSIASIHREMCTFCGLNNFAAPSYHQVYAISKNLSPRLKKLAHDGMKSYQNKYDIVYRREASHPNEIWQADHTLLDIVVATGPNKQGRPWLTIIMDDYSRSIAGYYLSLKAPSSIQTALALYQAIKPKEKKQWAINGIPEKFYTDHGSDFVSKHMEQVAIDLKMNLLFSKVGVPRGRGKIERFFLTVNQMLLQELPGYIPAGQQKQLLTYKELDSKIEHFITEVYHQKVHGTIKETPLALWNEGQFLPNLPENMEDLALLLLHVAKTRKVHSDGIYFQGLKYMNTNLAAYVNESVIIRYNPRDLAEIKVFYQDQFLCSAIADEISSYKISVDDISKARRKLSTALKQELQFHKTVSEEAIQLSQRTEELTPVNSTSKLKRYTHE